MDDDDIATWSEVQARLTPLGRGTPYRLAQALGMNSSFFYRKLKSGGDLTTSQRRQVLAFFREGGEPDPRPVRPSTAGLIPVYGYAAAGGEDLIALNDGEIVEWMRLPMGIAVGPGDWFVVKAVGSSMEPRIFAGDDLLVRRKHPVARGKDVLIEFHDGSGVIKTYEGERQGRVFARQWNEEKIVSYGSDKVRALHGGIVKL
jgi:SOS-response transcriptional repressor LexA